MLQRLKNVIHNLTYALFLVSFIITLYYFFIEPKLSPYFSLINLLSTKKLSEQEKSLVYSSDTQKVIKYPRYGDKYGSLLISSIDLNLPVYYGDNPQILRYGIGQYPGSFFPGENGTIIYAGHNNPGILNNLDKVSFGDIINIQTIYGNFNYQVDDIRIINENDLSNFKVKRDNEELILYTCYPIDLNFFHKSERLIIYAKKIGDE